MSEIRKIEKEVEKYKKIILYNPQIAKVHVEEYTKNISIIEEIINRYLRDMAYNFIDLCSVNMDIFESEQDSLLQKLQKTIEKFLVNYLLNKTCRNISKGERIKKNIDEIQTRFNQYKYILKE